MTSYFMKMGSARIPHEHWDCGGWSTVGQPRWRGWSGSFSSEALAVTAFAECLYRVGRQALRFPRLQQEGSDGFGLISRQR